MLRFADFCLSHMEIPGETSICIYITGCTNRCKDCHYPDLQSPAYGEPLSDRISLIYDLYGSMATCVCFLGEGGSTEAERTELSCYADMAHGRGLKCCLYSGRDKEIEEWMNVFDYVKTGSFQPDKGPLTSPKTNQRMYRKTSAGYADITNVFWQKNH